MPNASRRSFLGAATGGVAASALGPSILLGQKPGRHDQQGKQKANAYSVVRVTVKETREYCPFYKPGDTFFIRQQCFDPATATPKQFCIHSLKDIYETYMKVRKGPVGNKQVVGCGDHGIAQFEIERLADEKGPGWNRPAKNH